MRRKPWVASRRIPITKASRSSRRSRTSLTDEVWTTLLAVRPPWGGTFRDVVTLYKNALGGECPFVVSNDDAPSCGTNSARFGCWTCTVVEKDSSIESLIAAGHEDLLPLADYRKRLKAVSENPEYRSKTRRNGQPGLGPLTYEARRMLLEELLAFQGDRDAAHFRLGGAVDPRAMGAGSHHDIVRSLPQLALAEYNNERGGVSKQVAWQANTSQSRHGSR